MTTQYTTILKLALPVQGELSGTWGDVVNDNITQMVEQAVAGKAVVNTWTGNSHTLTTADGTTSESRCAILELTDSGTALTGAGTVVCPTNTKLYIVDNNTAEIITVQTVAGTGVAVPVGKTMLVYCDGTNVVEGVTHANSLSLGTSTVTADKILDEDNMASDSATAIATQQSIKAYVDSQVGTVDTLSEILANGNTTGANDIDVDSAQKVQFRDAAIYINSSVDGQLDIVADGEVQIDTALVDINGNLDVSGTTNISGSVSFTKNAIAGVAISTTSRSSNTVTVTTSAVHGLTSGDLVNVNGVADTSFNGYFTVSVSSTTVFTYNQTGSDGSSTGGTSTEVVYNLNASGTALNWMNGPLNIAANSGIDGLEITQSGSGEALSITGGNAIFGDNDKAVFGAGSDLQIYHDGTDSFISDQGTGNLKLLANDFRLANAANNELMLKADQSSAVTAYYAGAEKLATTATGIDVTGTVTADGLTVEAASGAEAARFVTNDATAANNAGALIYNIASATAATRNSQFILDPSGANASGGDYLVISAKGDNSASIINYHATSTLALGTAGIERLRIDASGRALFGHSAAIAGTKVEISAVGDGGALGLFGRASDDTAYIGFFQNGVTTRTALIQATLAAGLQFIGGSGSTPQMTLDTSGAITTTSSATFGGSVALAGSSGGLLLNDSATADNTIQLNTTGGTTFVGSNGSAGNRFLGSSAYASTFGTTAANALELATNNTVRMTIASTGAATFSGTVTATGGVVFGDAGGSGTPASNTLDSYEEGTWTPALANIGTGTYTHQVGRYTKIGNLVTASVHIDINVLGTASGSVDITNLPFTASAVSNNYGSASSIHAQNFTTAAEGLNVLINPNTAVANVFSGSGATSAAVNLTHAVMGTGNLLCTLVYFTA
jgi:hypothetical protein